MANIVLGCDKNNSNDTKYRDTVAQILTKAGHNVEKLTISPTPFGSYGYKSQAKGKIGIYLMASSLVSVTDVWSSGWNFKYTYFGIRADASRLIRSNSDFNSKHIPKDHHGDCTGAICDRWAGKTYPQINEIIKNKGKVVFSPSAEEFGNNIVNLLGGGSDSTSSKNNENDSGSGGNVRDCIQKLLKHWDGDVECRIQGKDVYINKIRDPEKYHSCALTEGVNIFRDNTTITDVNPDTPNHLIVEWSGGTIEYRDEKAIFRFGEKIKKIKAVKKVVKEVKENKKSNSNNTSNSNEENNTGTTADENGNTTGNNNSDNNSTNNSS